MNEDWACPQCGRDDFRCKCDWPMPTAQREAIDAKVAGDAAVPGDPEATRRAALARISHARCHWPSRTSVGQDEADA